MSRARHLVFGAPVPVLARSDRQVPGPAAVVPEVGLRWGQPSEFEFGLPGEPTSDLPPAVIIQRGEPRVFRGTESYRAWGEETPAAGITVESIKRTAFFLGERTEIREQRKVEGNVTTVEPIVETIREYVEFDFAFAVVGDRGELPPRPTQFLPPPPPSPKIAGVSDLSPFRTIIAFESIALWEIEWRLWEYVAGGGASGTEAGVRQAYEDALDRFDDYEAAEPDATFHRELEPPHQEGSIWTMLAILYRVVRKPPRTIEQPADWTPWPYDDARYHDYFSADEWDNDGFAITDVSRSTG